MEEAVLFVDDEVNILNSLRRGLIDVDYKCFFASSGKEALEIMKKTLISVIVTDMRMPEMDGLTLLKEVKEKYPMTVRIVLSGYTQLQQILVTINQVDIFKFITKPWKLEEEFKVVIDQALEYYRLLMEREGLRKSMESKNLAYQKILIRIDEVIASAKNDVQIARGAGIQTVDYIGRLIESGKPLDVIKEEVKSIGRAFHSIMNAVAPDSSDTQLNEILEKYVTLLKSRKQIINVEYSGNAEFKKLYLKPEIISFALSIIEEFISEEETYNIKFINGYKPISPETGLFEIAVLILAQEDNSADALKKVNSNETDDKIGVINNLFCEYFKLYKGYISATKVDDKNIAVKIQLFNKK